MLLVCRALMQVSRCKLECAGTKFGVGFQERGVEFHEVSFLKFHSCLRVHSVTAF